MSRAFLSSEVDELEITVRKQNAIRSELFLRALRSNHEPFDAEVEPEPVEVPVEPEPLLPISNEVFSDASDFAEEISRGFSPVIRVLRAVSAHTGVPVWEIRSERRTQRVVRPRQYVYYLSRKLTVASSPAIARQLGGRDHTCVLAGIRRIDQLRRIDPKIESDLQEIATSLGGSLA